MAMHGTSSAVHAPGLSVAQAIAIAQAEQLHRTWPTLSAGAALGFIAAYLCRATADPGFLLAWTFALTAQAAIRLAQWRHYREQPFDQAIARRIISPGRVGASLSGLLWGGGLSYLLVGASPLQQALLLLTAMGLSISAIFSYGVHLPTFRAFYALSVVSLVPTLAFQAAPESHWFAAGMLIFVITIWIVAANFNRMVLRSLALGFENLELIRQLTSQKDLAESANLSKSRFLAAASHDLRQPMHAFGLYLGALDGVNLPAQGRQLSHKLRQCMHGMEGLFNGLLDLSQLDAQAIRPEPHEFSISTVLERVRVDFEPQALAKGLAFRVAPCSARVSGDAMLIERMLRNLASNAVRYTERGKILIGCRRRADGRLCVGVYDTGIGIACPEQSRIFDEFVQLANPRRDRNQGIGLGLSIVDRLARLQKLHVAVHSVPGRGSVFSVDLPWTAGVAAQAHTDYPRAVTDTRLARSLAGCLVVVVDDELPIQDATRGLLESWGCRVVAASSMPEAFVRLDGLPAPDLLLCDFRLGNGANGIGAVQALREEFNQEVPAIMVTGDTAPQRLLELAASGIPVLHKPLEAEMLRRAMLGALRSRKPHLNPTVMDARHRPLTQAVGAH